MISIRNKWKQVVPVCIAAALLLTGCSTAGETDADVEEFLGVQLQSSTSELTAQDALKKAEDFVNAAAPDQFQLSLSSEEPQLIGDQQVYLIQLTTQSGGAAYEPFLAVDAGSGILYSYYSDGTLKPATEDETWENITEVASLTPEEQQNLAEAGSYASEVLSAGTADFVLTLKTGQYVYADANAVYVGYGGSEQRSFTFEGMADVTDVSCYSVLMTEGGAPAVRLYVDESKTYMVMLDEDCDGTPEETVNINE